MIIQVYPEWVVFHREGRGKQECSESGTWLPHEMPLMVTQYMPSGMLNWIYLASAKEF